MIGLTLMILSAGGLLGGCTPEAASTIEVQATGRRVAGDKSSATISAAQALEQWLEAASGKRPPAPIPAASAPRPQPPVIDVAALAARHPAWKLADALETNRLSALRFEPVGGVEGARVSAPAPPSFDVEFQTDGRPNATDASSNDATDEFATFETENTSATPVTAKGLDDLQEAARADQRNTIDGFLEAAASRQTDWQGRYRAIADSALEEEIAARAERNPEALSVVLPSPEVQLEMTNLRLQLLNNIFSTEEERTKARERLDELTAEWSEDLRRQESERRAELQRLRVEEPARLRREGTARLQSELETIRNAQAVIRDTIAVEHRARLEQDFGAEQARLAIVLPAALSLTDGVLPLPAAPRSSRQARAEETAIGDFSFIRTLAPRRASGGGFAGVPAVSVSQSGGDAARIRALRRLAWKDAVRQAQMMQRLAR